MINNLMFVYFKVNILLPIHLLVLLTNQFSVSKKSTLTTTESSTQHHSLQIKSIKRQIKYNLSFLTRKSQSPNSVAPRVLLVFIKI